MRISMALSFIFFSLFFSYQSFADDPSCPDNLTRRAPGGAIAPISHDLGIATYHQFYGTVYMPPHNITVNGRAAIEEYRQKIGNGITYRNSLVLLRFPPNTFSTYYSLAGQGQGYYLTNNPQMANYPNIPSNLLSFINGQFGNLTEDEIQALAAVCIVEGSSFNDRPRPFTVGDSGTPIVNENQKIKGILWGSTGSYTLVNPRVYATDVNGNGQSDINDLLLFVDWFHQNNPNAGASAVTATDDPDVIAYLEAHSDRNNDGAFNIFDLTQFLNEFSEKVPNSEIWERAPF